MTAKTPSTNQEVEEYIGDEQETQNQLNELAEEKKKGNGRKRVSKQTDSAKKEQQKGEESTPTDTGEGYVPAVTPSRKLLFSSLLVFITVCNKVEKVMFLHVSVCLSVYKGGSNWDGNPNWDKVDPQIRYPHVRRGDSYCCGR